MNAKIMLLSPSPWATVKFQWQPAPKQDPTPSLFKWQQRVKRTKRLSENHLRIPRSLRHIIASRVVEEVMNTARHEASITIHRQNMAGVSKKYRSACGTWSRIQSMWSHVWDHAWNWVLFRDSWSFCQNIWRHNSPLESPKPISSPEASLFLERVLASSWVDIYWNASSWESKVC